MEKLLEDLDDEGALSKLLALEDLDDADLADLIDLDALEKLERDIIAGTEEELSSDSEEPSPSPPPIPKVKKRKHSDPPAIKQEEKGKRAKIFKPQIQIKRQKAPLVKKQEPVVTKKVEIKPTKKDVDVAKKEEKDEHKYEKEEIYCICRKPMGNKFMIGCDSCEEWYHGSCVGISAEQGRQMEKAGEDFTCSKCSQNKKLDSINSYKQSDNRSQKKKVATVAPMKHYSPESKYSRSYDYDIVERSTTKCKIDGCPQFSMKNSPFCSQQCVLKFAQDSMKGDMKAAAPKPKQPISKEISEPKPSQPNPLRKGIRKHLLTFLSDRAKEAVDLTVTDEEITKLVQNIEMALYKMFPDCGNRYKAKIKAIFFNIRDPKNDNLYHNILSGTLSADKLVRMSTQEMSMRTKSKPADIPTEAITTVDNTVNVMAMLEDTTSQHGTHVFSNTCKRCTGKSAKKKEEEKEEKEETAVAEPVPNRMALSAKPLKDPLGLNPALWKGYITMTSLTKFSTSGYHVYGPHNSLLTTLPETLHVQGRIANNIVWAYVDRLRNSPVKELVILKFESQIPDEVQGYSNLFHYLCSRSRCGVIGNVTTPVRDMYLVPLSAEGAMPPQLRLLGVSSIPKKNRTNLILGLIVINKTSPPKRPGPLDIPFDSVPGDDGEGPYHDHESARQDHESARHDHESARQDHESARQDHETVPQHEDESESAKHEQRQRARELARKERNSAHHVQRTDTAEHLHLATFPTDISMPFDFGGEPSNLEDSEDDSVDVEVT